MSAGTLSPVVSITKSPGTKYFASNISSLPSLNSNSNSDSDSDSDSDSNSYSYSYSRVPPRANLGQVTWPNWPANFRFENFGQKSANLGEKNCQFREVICQFWGKASN